MTPYVKLAVKKEPGAVPGSGFHYMLFPKAMDSDGEAALMELIGYEIIEVEPEKAQRLLRDAGAALRHQVEIAFVTEKQIASRSGAV